MKQKKKERIKKTAFLFGIILLCNAKCAGQLNNENKKETPATPQKPPTKNSPTPSQKKDQENKQPDRPRFPHYFQRFNS